VAGLMWGLKLRGRWSRGNGQGTRCGGWIEKGALIINVPSRVG
jgi:hypothetical protein